MPTIMKYRITVQTPGGVVVRRFDDPEWMVAALNAHPEWRPAGGEYLAFERTLGNELAVAAVVAAADAERAAAPDLAYHGSVNGYTNHGCRCVACTAAHAEDYDRRRRRDRPPLPLGDPRHGTDSAYHYHHCKCEQCLAAHAAAHPKANAGTGPPPYQDWEIELLRQNLTTPLAELAERTGRSVSAVQKKRARLRAERNMQPA